MDLSDFKAWLIERELADNTLDSYLYAMRNFFESFSQANQENGIAWKKSLLASGLSPQTVNLRLCGFNAYCKMQGIPAHVKRLKIQKKVSAENVITRTEYEKLLRCLKEDGKMKWYFGIKLMATTGARVSELVRITKSDFDRGYSEMWTKGKIRRIYIPKSFQDEAKTFYEDLSEDTFLLSSRYGKQITTRGVDSCLRYFASKYEIDKKTMHPHAFRHLFAIEFLKRNNNLSLLADVMGHSSVATTAIYTRLTSEQQKAAVSDTVNW